MFIKNVNGSDKNLMHKAKRPSNYFSNTFTHNQAEQIKKGVISDQNFVRNTSSEYGRFHFQGWSTFYTPVLVTVMQCLYCRCYICSLHILVFNKCIQYKCNCTRLNI